MKGNEPLFRFKLVSMIWFVVDFEFSFGQFGTFTLTKNIFILHAQHRIKEIQFSYLTCHEFASSDVKNDIAPLYICTIRLYDSEDTKRRKSKATKEKKRNWILKFYWKRFIFCFLVLVFCCAWCLWGFKWFNFNTLENTNIHLKDR